MINEMGPNIDISMFKAHETMATAAYDDTAYRYRVVCLNSDKEVCYPTAITDIPFGVLIEGAPTGGYVTVRVFGVCPVKVIAALALPNVIGIATDGGAIDGRVNAAIATNYIMGQLLDSSDAEDDIITAMINCLSMPIKA